MRYLTFLISLILLMITAQPGWAQQQDTLRDSTSIHMEMMQDSTMQGNMMGMCMNMMNNMESDSTMSGNMMGGDMSDMCMKMCMNMMDMENMPDNRDSGNSTQRENGKD